MEGLWQQYISSKNLGDNIDAIGVVTRSVVFMQVQLSSSCASAHRLGVAALFQTSSLYAPSLNVPVPSHYTPCNCARVDIVLRSSKTRADKVAPVPSTLFAWCRVWRFK